MHRPRAIAFLLLPFIFGFAAGCGAPERTPEPAAVSETKPAGTSSAPVEATTPEPEATIPEPEPPKEPAEPAAELPAGDEFAATKPGPTRVGTAICKVCHKVQHASWAAGAHAALDPQVDCESCHGPGSEYKALAVMKDPAKAAAAGLVNPGKAFCTESCHATGWEDGMLARTHAHKPKWHK